MRATDSLLYIYASMLLLGGAATVRIELRAVFYGSVFCCAETLVSDPCVHKIWSCRNMSAQLYITSQNTSMLRQRRRLFPDPLRHMQTAELQGSEPAQRMTHLVSCGGHPFPGAGCPVPNLIWWYFFLNIIENEIINVWDTVYIFIHHPGVFLSMYILFEQRIGQFTMDLLYIRFTYCTTDNQ